MTWYLERKVLTVVARLFVAVVTAVIMLITEKLSLYASTIVTYELVGRTYIYKRVQLYHIPAATLHESLVFG